MALKKSAPTSDSRCPRCSATGLRIRRSMRTMPVLAPGGRSLEVRVPVESIACPRCRFAVLTPASVDACDDAASAALGLLTATEISAARKRLGLSREALSELTGIGTASIFRWEKRRKRQSRSNDLLLRMALGLGGPAAASNRRPIHGSVAASIAAATPLRRPASRRRRVA